MTLNLNLNLNLNLSFWRRCAAVSLATIAALASSKAHAVIAPPPQGTWQTTLQPLDLDHDSEPDAFYDTVLNITWLRNANANMDMVWADAQSWASKLVVGGVGGWRLPTMVDTGEPGCELGAPGQSDCGFNPSLAGNEMAHLYYVTLGNSANPSHREEGRFQNLAGCCYWTGVAAPYSDFDSSFLFDPSTGEQLTLPNDGKAWAMAVHDGNLAAVPEPQTQALLLLGLVAVGVAARGRRR